MFPWSHHEGTDTIQASSGTMEPRKSVLYGMVNGEGDLPQFLVSVCFV
jgi:hypothetical protein